MARGISIPVGVVLAREAIDHPWQDHQWRLAGLLPGTDKKADWSELASGPGWTQYHAATLPLELYVKEAEAYMVNLQNTEPVIYAVLHESEDEEDEHPIYVHLITASPFEAQDYLDSGEVQVESISMPEQILSLVTDFVEEHHVEEKFKKRKRDKVDLEEHKFGQEPIFKDRKRMNGHSDE